MGYSYSGDPSESALDAVRYKIQDIDLEDLDDWLLSDEEIEYELAQAGNSVLKAAANCAETIAGRFSKKVTKQTAGDRIDYSDLAKQYYALAEALREQASKTKIAVAYSGSTGVDSVFKRDMMTIRGCQTDDNDGVAE